MKRLLGLLLALLIATPALAQTSGGDSTFTNPVAIGGQNYTFPASSATLAGLGTTQAWTGANTYSNAAPITFTSTATSGQVWCNTADCTTNYERSRAYWTGNILTTAIEIGGTGTARGFQWTTNGKTLSYGSDGTFGANGGNFAWYAGGQIGWAGRGGLVAVGDGHYLLWNAAQNNLGRLDLGGITSSFPSIKRSGTTVAIRLADDSADAPLSASAFTANGSAGVTCSGTPTSSFASVSGIVTHC